MTTMDTVLLAEVLRHALDGVAVVEGSGGAPRVIYANATLAALLRQPEEWPVGRELGEFEIEAPADPNATTIGIGQRVRLRRADGTTVECERWALMLADAKILITSAPSSATSRTRARISASFTWTHSWSMTRPPSGWSVVRAQSMIWSVPRRSQSGWISSVTWWYFVL
jgi:hypothetical protein